MENVFQQALEEMQPVREMTVEEVAQFLYGKDPAYYHGTDYLVSWEDAAPPYKDACYNQAKALAKLGTIRITGE